MAKKPGNKGTDTKVLTVADVKKLDRELRNSMQIKRHLRNIELRREGLPTPWMIAKAARAERRRGMAPQERTGLGNIIVLEADGHKRIKPGSKREMELMIDLRQRERAEGSAERKKPAKRAKKVKTA